MHPPKTKAATWTSRQGESAAWAGLATISRKRQLNWRRFKWFAAGLLLFLISSLWFCYLQLPLPVGLEPVRASFGRWCWYPREDNAHKRLPTLPLLTLTSAFFTNDLGWMVSRGGQILHTENGGRSWTLQTNIDWGETLLPRVPEEMELEKEPSARQSAARSQARPLIAPKAFGNIGMMPDQEFRQANQAAQNPIGKLNEAPPPASVRMPRTRQSLRAVFFISTQNGWAVGDQGTILHTEDGGKHWKAQSAPTNQDLASVVFVNGQRGWVAGSEGTILHTKDGGRNWISQSARTRQSLTSIKFLDEQRGWAVGTGGVILQTANGGQTWLPQAPGTYQDINSTTNLAAITFVNEQSGWAVGNQGTILHTADGGRTWKNQTTGSKAWLVALAFVDAQRGWAVGDRGTILRTQDGGETWQAQAAHPLEFYRSIRFENPQSGWIMGEHGTLLRTADGGRTWSCQTANQVESLRSVHFVDALHGWTAGDYGTILHTRDGGNTWSSQTTNRPAWLSSIRFVDRQSGWAVGEQGAVLRTRDGGQTWNFQSILTNAWLASVIFVDAQNGWAVADTGAMVHTKDGGQTWQTQNINAKTRMTSVAFVGARHGWAVGASGTIRHTGDGGQSWRAQTVETQPLLRSVAFVDTRRGWAVGDHGTILQTEDGGQNWRPQDSPSKAHLNSVAFVTPQTGWVVGDQGTILHTQDGGLTWSPQAAPTAAGLNSVAFVGPQNGWAVGNNATILRTRDGGRTWQDARPYKRSPAGLFYIGLLGSLTFLLVGLVKAGPGSEETNVTHSIADYAVSDRPLTSREFDALNFGPLVEGIASYLVNKNTTGPLTLAVVGPWGSGKSSIMGMLREKMEGWGVRTVWFNAWHHQDEKQLLAALLESIRSQALPRWFSVRGLNFRIKLINRRLCRRWPLLLLATVLLGFLTAAGLQFGSDGLIWERMKGFLQSPLLAAGKLAIVVTALVTLYRILQDLKAFGLDPAKLLSSVTEKAKLSDLSQQTSFRHRFAREFEDVTIALQPLTMTVFIDDLDRCEPEQVMQVMQSLNFLSSSGECFLILGMEENAVTNCVAVSLKEQFNSQEGEKLNESDALKRRWQYAKLWMEKLIQIRIPVPDPNDEQFKALLTGSMSVQRPISRPAQMSCWEGWQQAWRTCQPFLPWSGLLALGLLGFFLTQWLLERNSQILNPPELADQPAPPVAWSSNSLIQLRDLDSLQLSLPEGIPGSALITSANLTDWVATQKWSLQIQFVPSWDTNLPLALPPSAASPGDMTPSPTQPTSDLLPGPASLAILQGQKDRTGWWIPLLLLPVFLIYAFRKIMDILDERYDDSDNFRYALRRWSKMIQRTSQTPRAAKRLVNKLRFYAMMSRALQKSQAVQEIPENAVVAFGVNEALIVEHRVAPDNELQQALNQEKAQSQSASSNGSLAQDLRDLETALRRQPEIFRYLSSTVKTESPAIQSTSLPKS